MRTVALALILSSAVGALGQVATDNAATSAYNASTTTGYSSIPSCPSRTSLTYDYIVVGAGAGGGPTAARLAHNGYKVLLIDAGPDDVSINTTIPLYLARASEDPKISLNYYVDLYAPGSGRSVKNWYPRSQGLGGSTIHNALIHQIPHNWDFNSIQSLFGDASWNADTMQKYLTRIENNLYIPPDIGTPLHHGYTGWLNTQAPASNLVTDPQYYDQKLIDMLTGVETAVLPVNGSDWSTNYNDLAEGGGIVPLTKNGNNTRSSIRDWLAATNKANSNALTFQLNTLATKILHCRQSNGRLKAYGVSAAIGQEIPVSSVFQGKVQSPKLTNYYAKNEIIVSTGTFQTPQLLMLSGIGEPEQLKTYNITPLVNLPGVGQNMQDRLEMTIVWHVNSSWVIWEGCKFSADPNTDPCLKAWGTSGHTNIYQSGPAVWAHSFKSDASLPYRDTWSMFGPGSFRGYHPGWSNEIADVQNAWIDVILKAHTASKGWVRLTGNHIQDTLNINKNQTGPGFEADIKVIVNEILRSRQLMANTTSMNRWVTEEFWPGKDYSTAAQLTEFVKQNTWGHHACCTSKMGKSSDPLSVVNNNFQVYGIDGLRVVDNSVWPNIPGMFVTTPIYMIAEKAADVISAYAVAQGWRTTYKAF